MLKLEVEQVDMKLTLEDLEFLHKRTCVVLVETVKQRLFDELLPALTIRNFYGEAAEYLYDMGHEITEDALEQYATFILEEFKEKADSLIYYNEETGNIDIHPAIMDFEFGSYYKPLAKLITKSLELILKDNLQ